MKKILWGFAALSITVMALTPITIHAEDAPMDEAVEKQAEEKHRDAKEEIEEGKDAKEETADATKTDEGSDADAAKSDAK